MKSMLQLLQSCQGSVPCTDSARRLMRHKLVSMTYWFGMPLLFVTLNPADVLHPFTWRSHLGTASIPVPSAGLDPFLAAALQSANLWRIVAKDPTAAVQAFHTHVNTFLSDLLDVNTSADALHPDGIASQRARGIFKPLSAAFGAIEPQQRGSLHIHFVLFCHAFCSPRALLERFTAALPTLEAHLWSWVKSIVATSFEAIPSMFNLDPNLLSTLRPLPYSDDNLRALHPSYHQHCLDMQDHWFAATPPQLLFATPPFINPFTGQPEAGKTFVPWSQAFLHDIDQHDISNEQASMLLYDLRTSIVHGGLLHSCRPKTCFKGKLGKRGYCRLGFWHWLDISQPARPHTWERCHGVQLCPAPILGTQPPHLDSFQTERHHLFFGRVNPVLLATCKCNHDISLLLRFPADYATAEDPVSMVESKMATSMSTILFYVTSYTTKTQPHLTSLWALLHAATQRHLSDLAKEPTMPEASIRARQTLSKLLLACQKRVHKSMPEMVSYLLGYDDFYCTHSFVTFFYADLASNLELLHPLSASSLSDADLQARSSCLLQADPSEDTSQLHSDEPSFPSTSHTWNFLLQPSADYPCRGDTLQFWPLYFYTAAVVRVSIRKSDSSHPACIPFTSDHPLHTSLRQQVLTKTPWRIPQLLGPRIPRLAEDPHRRAMLLLLLFKPWLSLRDLLPRTSGFTTWAEAWRAFEADLRAALPPPSSRASPFTPAYWAQRSLHIIEHIDLSSNIESTKADQEQQLNPDQLRGVPGATTVEHNDSYWHSDDDSDSDHSIASEHADADPLDHLHQARRIACSAASQTSTQTHKTKSLQYKQSTLTNFVKTIPTLHIYLHLSSSVRETYQSQATSSHHILPYLFGLHFGTTMIFPPRCMCCGKNSNIKPRIKITTR